MIMNSIEKQISLLKSNITELSEWFEKLENDIDSGNRRCQLTTNDIGGLVFLLKIRVCNFSAFDILLKSNSEAAFDVLHELYLGYGVDLDNTTRVHPRDLDMYFDSIFEYLGESGLRALLNSEKCSYRNKSSRWVLSAIGEVLDLDEVSVNNWFGSKPVLSSLSLRDILIKLLDYNKRDLDEKEISSWANSISKLFFDKLLIIESQEDQVVRYLECIKYLDSDIYSDSDVYTWIKDLREKI